MMIHARVSFRASAAEDTHSAGAEVLPCRSAARRSLTGLRGFLSPGFDRPSCLRRFPACLERARGGDEGWGTAALGGLAAATLLGLALLLV